VGWANRIVARRAADRVRRRVRARGREVTGDGVEGADRTAAGSEHSDLREAIERLSVDHREVVSLFYGRSMGVSEIAAVLGVPPGTVKSRLHHARLQLKNHLERNDHE